MAGATSPLEPRPPRGGSAGRAARSPSSSRPGAHRSHAAGARTPGALAGRRGPGATGPESCKLCAGLARRGSRSAPGRSPGAAANPAPGGSGGAEGGVSGRLSPGQRAVLFTAVPPALAVPPSLPPSSPARALRAPDIIHSRTLACPLLLPAVTHPGPEVPAGTRGLRRLPRPCLFPASSRARKTGATSSGGDCSRPSPLRP